MRNAIIVVIALVALGIGGKIYYDKTKKEDKPEATIKIRYVTGEAKAGAFAKSSKLELSNPSFDGEKVVFTYKNLHKDENGILFSVTVQTYNSKGVTVDVVSELLVPGEVSIPCEGKVIEILTNSKQQEVAKVVIDHLGTFSMDRFKSNLNKMLGK